MTVESKKYWWKSIASFLFVLLMMPLGHALMILMEHTLSETALHYSAFAMGAVGLTIAIAGIYVKGDTRQTMFGLIGGMFFWTGWVEFLFMYYANRYGTQPQLDPLTGEVVTKPEYLILPATFGFWVLIMALYVFRAKTGCNFINWWQKVLQIKDLKPMKRDSSLVAFLELNMIMWTSYLLLMFCYDPRFLGDSHPVTPLVGLGCLIGSFFIFAKQLRISAWGANIRMAIATVIVFWTPVEILGRNNILNEIWVAPLQHITEMTVILLAFLALGGYLCIKSIRRK